MKKYNIIICCLSWLLLASCSKKDNGGTVIPPVGATQNDIATVDSKVSGFMSTYNIPGASLAVTKNGKLVYRKGYGVADQSNNEKVTADHRFRLASVSKTYTAVAIMKLMQDGKLSLDNKVFGAGNILGTDYGSQPYGANITNITVKQLLQHTSGAWGAASGGDVIDYNPSYANKQFLDWVLNTRPAANTPGTKFDYSNINYFILARIVEKITGKTFLNYLQQDILNGLGITKTELAGITLNDRKSNEVKYYGQGTDAPYVYSILFTRRDGDGGLIATPSDLLRFVTAIDGFSTRPDILNASTLTVFTTPSGPAPLDPNYACGIGVYNDVWYNYGSLPGTRTGFMRANNGLCIALLFNSAAQSNTFIYDMQDIMLNTLHDTTIQWQDIDQF